MASLPAAYLKLTPTYKPLNIVLAYLLAAVGAWTALELLLTRTGTRGLRNAGLLVAAGLTFGSTTFGMHFVGNQALMLRYPPSHPNQPPLELAYDPGFAWLSFVVACISMTAAFSIIGLRLDLRCFRRAKPPKTEEHVEPEMMETITETQDETKGDVAPTVRRGSAVSWLTFGDSGASAARRHSVSAPVLGRRNSPFAHNPFVAGGRRGSIRKPTELDEIEEGPPDVREVVDEDDEEDDGDFGLTPSRLSMAGVWKILCAGLICGAGIAGMHYIGQVSINNVAFVTNTPFVVFLAVVIACGAVSSALYLLFVVFRPKLAHQWYKRLAIAALLGYATTLMHFVALLGSQFYVLDDDIAAPPGGDTVRVITDVVSVTAPLCCLTLIAIALIAQRRAHRRAAGRHLITVAVIIFDHQGHLLVQSEDGHLPSTEIFPEAESGSAAANFLRSFGFSRQMSFDATERTLDRSDSAFIAMIRASWAWKQEKLDPLGLQSPPATVPHDLLREGCELQQSSLGSNQNTDRIVAAFEAAVKDLSTRVVGADASLGGVLFDRILKTGQYQREGPNTGYKFLVTQGRMMIITRRLNTPTEREPFLTRGFTFVEPTLVANNTGTALAVRPARVFDFFRDAYCFTRYGVVKYVEPARIFAGVLVLQAVPGEGLHVLVDVKQHHSLPMVEIATLVDDSELPSSSGLPNLTLDDVQLALSTISGATLSDLVDSPSSDTPPLVNSMISLLVPFLRRTLPDECMNNVLPRLVVTPTLIPLVDTISAHQSPDQASYLICLKSIIPSSIEISASRSNWLPFLLYKAEAECVAKYATERRHPVRTSSDGPAIPANARRRGSVQSGRDSRRRSVGQSPSMSLSRPSLTPTGSRDSASSAGSDPEPYDDEDYGVPRFIFKRPSISIDQVVPPTPVAPFDPSWAVTVIRDAVQPALSCSVDATSLSQLNTPVLGEGTPRFPSPAAWARTSAEGRDLPGA